MNIHTCSLGAINVGGKNYYRSKKINMQPAGALLNKIQFLVLCAVRNLSLYFARQCTSPERCFGQFRILRVYCNYFFQILPLFKDIESKMDSVFRRFQTGDKEQKRQKETLNIFVRSLTHYNFSKYNYTPETQRQKGKKGYLI